MSDNPILFALKSHWRLIGIGLIITLTMMAFAGLWLRGESYRNQRDKERNTIAEMKTATKAADNKYRAAEQFHANQTAKIEKDKADEISSIIADRDDLLAELRNRPRRPTTGTSQTAAAPENGPGATGHQLYAEDAEFLVGEAERADTIRAEVMACYKQYDSLVEALSLGDE